MPRAKAVKRVYLHRDVFALWKSLQGKRIESGFAKFLLEKELERRKRYVSWPGDGPRSSTPVEQPGMETPHLSLALTPVRGPCIDKSLEVEVDVTGVSCNTSSLDLKLSSADERHAPFSNRKRVRNLQ